MDIPPESSAPLLRVRNLSVHFSVTRGLFRRAQGSLRAVDGVNFDLAPGECLGIVGRSGCGKTTLGRAVLRLVPISNGEITLNGVNAISLRAGALRRWRREVQVIFQDPGGSLSPRMRVGEIVEEPLLVHSLAPDRAERRRLAIDVLARCGMDEGCLDRFPHEFSGGQRQRIAIARALVSRPRLIVCDEPTSSLDVSVQAQILNLLSDLRDQSGLAYLFISHDLAVVRHMCTRIAVMEQGRIVEFGTREAVVGSPQHPCTRGLLADAPALHPFQGHAARIA